MLWCVSLRINLQQLNDQFQPTNAWLDKHSYNAHFTLCIIHFTKCKLLSKTYEDKDIADLQKLAVAECWVAECVQNAR